MERIGTISISKKIKIIDETLFEGWINLKEFEFLCRNTLLKGNILKILIKFK